MTMDNITLDYPCHEVAILALKRPQSLNALSWDLVREPHQVPDAINADNRCRVVVLAGAGKGFCAGMERRDQASPGALIEGMPRAPQAALIAQNFMASLVQDKEGA